MPLVPAFFLTEPEGLMIWLLLAFFVAIYILYRFAWKRITGAIDTKKEQIVRAIDDSDSARVESERLLAEYRERLEKAERQAGEIVKRAEQAGEGHRRAAEERARQVREELLERTRRDVEAETRRAIQEIRNEVADLTIQATGIVTRRTLSEDDQRQLVEQALSDIDLSALSEAARQRGTSA